MKIENQVCTLEQAKKLKELLNLGQWKNVDFNFYWMLTEGALDYFLTTGPRVGGYAYPIDQVPCFTVAELGVMLPSETGTQRTGSEDSDYANWEWADDNNQMGMGMFATEAEARADCIICLLEKKLITPEEVNNRLNQ